MSNKKGGEPGRSRASSGARLDRRLKKEKEEKELEERELANWCNGEEPIQKRSAQMRQRIITKREKKEVIRKGETQTAFEPTAGTKATNDHKGVTGLEWESGTKKSVSADAWKGERAHRGGRQENERS